MTAATRAELDRAKLETLVGMEGDGSEAVDAALDVYCLWRSLENKDERLEVAVEWAAFVSEHPWE